MRVFMAFCLVAVLQAAGCPARSDDVTPLNAPENDLIARALADTPNGALRLAPFTQRVWSEDELLRLCAESNVPQAKAIRRLLLGADAPEARAVAGTALLTTEQSPRLAWRVSGIYSLNAHADLVLSLDTTRSLYEQRPLMPWAYMLQLRWYTSLGEWRIGQAPLRWGGGYSGAMLLSDAAPPLLHIDYRQQWYLGKRLGSWQFEQMATLFDEDGSRRYVMARRLSHALSPRWQISLSEAFKSNKLPAGLSALILPFYLYQHLSSWRLYEGNDEWLNYLANVQIQYRFAQQRLYVDLLLDDLQAPHWLTRFRYTTPRKSGVLIGYHTPLPQGGQFLVEIAHTDGDPGGGVYNFKVPENRWRYRDAVLGHPVGTNRDMLFLRLDLPVSQKSYLAIEHVNTRRANATPLVPIEQRWTVYAGWLLWKDCGLGARWSVRRIQNTSHTHWLVYIGGTF
ncbi:MAG: capsule assembly Wzi family protein [Armatimonadota bacterium]|nr:capsule assembly Wzi family protein [bacterium]MDW8321743.1 capsule assembly Wzi family protein [Armatimonadota bacterium]